MVDKNEMIELDHLFILTSVDAPEAAALIELGLEEGPGNVHPGQGTSNRRFFFEHNFLELLWVHDEEEVRTSVIAPTHLWERSRSSETGYSPFGLCVRPSADGKAVEERDVLPETWAYIPPYLPAGRQIEVVDNSTHPQEPMLFQIPPLPISGNDRTPQMVRRQHPLGVLTITKLRLLMPVRQSASLAMTRLLAADWLDVEDAEKLHMILEFDHCRRQKAADLSPQLPLTLKW